MYIYKGVSTEAGVGVQLACCMDTWQAGMDMATLRVRQERQPCLKMLLLQEVPFVRDDSWKRDAVRAIQTVAKLQSAAAFLEPVREEEVSLGQVAYQVARWVVMQIILYPGLPDQPPHAMAWISEAS